MSIAEKLTTIAENEQKVYKAGKKSQYDEFWDVYQSNGTRKDYNHAFGGRGWNKETFKPKYDLKFSNMERSFLLFNDIATAFDLVEHLDNLGIKFDTKGCSRYYYAFFNARINHLPTIDISQAKDSANNNCFSTSYLKIIDKLIFGEGSILTNVFADATGLTTITEIEGNICTSVDFKWSPLLKDTIINIINALSETATGYTITFKKTAINNAFGINVDDVTTYPEGSEFYNLRNSKSNWNFSYA